MPYPNPTHLACLRGLRDQHPLSPPCSLIRLTVGCNIKEHSEKIQRLRIVSLLGFRSLRSSPAAQTSPTLEGIGAG